MSNLKRIAIVVVFGLSVTGCGSLRAPTMAPPGRAVGPLTIPEVERAYVKPGGEDWGLAFSGGGLRSALVSIGVAKALFDSGDLSRFGYLSSVSGGSYASYWLYAAHKDGTSFGDGALGARTFGTQMCRIVGSKFYSYPAMAWDLLHLKTPDVSYENHIVGMFGNNPNRQLRDLASEAEKHRTPFPIFNATVRVPRDLHWLDQLFEFTPIGAHAGGVGEVSWGQENDFRVSRAVAISGAALKVSLSQWVVAPFNGTQTAVKLSDGGHSENLGAVSLVRRGVKNIVVIDSEMDAEFEFGAYKKLRDGLSEMGLRLVSPVLDSQVDFATAAMPYVQRSRTLDRAVNIAKVYAPSSVGGSAKLISTIYYVKMSLSTELYDALSDANAQLRGQHVAKAFYDSLSGENLNAGKCSDLMPAFTRQSTRDWAVFAVRAYRDNPASSPLFSRLSGAGHYSFPHQSTADQSYYQNQSASFVGLGYLEGLAVAKTLRRAGPR